MTTKNAQSAEDKAAAKAKADQEAAEQSKAELNAKALELSGLDQEVFDALTDEEKEVHLKAAAEAIEAEAKAKADDKGPKLVKMFKDDGSKADVHPDEVENYKLGDWKVK
jgi:predicted TPR repeat methyltransferase